MVRTLHAVPPAGRLFVAVWAVFAAFAACRAQAEQAQRPVLDQLDPAGLVQALGAPQFSVRERAMLRLVQTGPEALAALRQGVQSEDREIRFRSQRVLTIIESDEFQRRLRAFAAGNRTTQESDLPCWNLFREQVGEDAVARRLFVEMQKSEPKLLRTFAESPAKAFDALATRVQEIQMEIRLDNQQDQIEMGSVAAVLFVANNQQRTYPLQTAQYISTCFYFPNFRSALENGEESDLLRVMLGKWIAGSEGWTAYQGIMLALQYDIPEGLTAAKRLLKDAPNQPNQPYFRFYALSAVGRFGSATDIADIERYLDDKTPYATAVPANRETKYRTQIRDVALAVILHLAGQDHRLFGFDRLRKNTNYLFDPNSLAFADDAQRDQAIKKWRKARGQLP